MADMTPRQIEELLEVLNKIAKSLQGIHATLKQADLNTNLNRLVQKTGR